MKGEVDNMDSTIITLENNKNYVLLSTIDIDNNKYFYMAEELNPEDLCIRKVVIDKDNDEALVKLDNKEELNKVLSVFNEMYRKDKNE